MNESVYDFGEQNEKPQKMVLTMSWHFDDNNFNFSRNKRPV